jgi:hypothetical protein
MLKVLIASNLIYTRLLILYVVQLLNVIAIQTFFDDECDECKKEYNEMKSLTGTSDVISYREADGTSTKKI